MATDSPFSTPKRKRAQLLGEDLVLPGLDTTNAQFSFELHSPLDDGSASPRTRVAHRFRNLALVEAAGSGSGGGVSNKTPTGGNGRRNMTSPSSPPTPPKHPAVQQEEDDGGARKRLRPDVEMRDADADASHTQIAAELLLPQPPPPPPPPSWQTQEDDEESDGACDQSPLALAMSLARTGQAYVPPQSVFTFVGIPTTTSTPTPTLPSRTSTTSSGGVSRHIAKPMKRVLLPAPAGYQKAHAAADNGSSSSSSSKPKPKSRGRKRSGTPPLKSRTTPPPSSDSDTSSSEGSSVSVVDPLRASLTWHEDEITIYDPNDSDDDGTGINGIGFKPTPAIARARTVKRRQQLAEYRRREEREARAKRNQRRRESPNPGLVELKGTVERRKVRFLESATEFMIGV
ncbi:hypothetical protein QBC46DRAFT_398230 [Diplogelasinospora grovesii]|uniref:Uncharacterized protein n=1 Tax=Diplogelasinospora grovesii TaxID=303347 RepID=A0AAN6MX51_9PEZI|nr:hypothetical protein QBC46DRAFT_398230 [Diplogelasinospora grovesii]